MILSEETELLGCLQLDLTLGADNDNPLGQGERNNRVILRFFRNTLVPSGSNDDELLAVLPSAVGYRRGSASARQFVLPQFSSRFNVKCSNRPIDHRARDEHETSRGNNRPAEAWHSFRHGGLIGSH